MSEEKSRQELRDTMNALRDWGESAEMVAHKRLIANHKRQVIKNRKSNLKFREKKAAERIQET